MDIHSRRQRKVVVLFLIATNIFVYILWNYPLGISPEFMEHNFLISWDLLTTGHYFGLVGSSVSQIQFLHIFINMYVLNNFGSLLELILGPSFFLGFYVVAGIVSSLSHCLVSAFILGTPEVPVLGASGSVSGLVVLFSFLFAKEKILIFGLIPVPALFGAFIFIALDIWGLVAQAQGGGLPIGHGAHLGGALTGALCYFFILRPRMRRRDNNLKRFS